MKKGSQILVEGRIQTKSWDKEDGTKAYRTEIIAETAKFGAKPQVGQSNEKELDLFEKKDEPVIDPETGNDCSEIPF
jgi:single-strand DNA-binding protein